MIEDHNCPKCGDIIHSRAHGIEGADCTCDFQSYDESARKTHHKGLEFWVMLAAYGLLGFLFLWGMS